MELPLLQGGTFNWAEGINDKGQIIGFGSTAAGTTHAVLWESGTISDLGTLAGGVNSLAHGINNRGQIVGQSDNQDGLFHAALWENGRIIDLGTLPGGTQSAAFDINNRGQIVGQSNTADGETHAVLWHQGAITDLGTVPSGTFSTALAINDSGQIVGSGNSPGDMEAGDQVDHALLWKNATLMDLGMLPGVRGIQAFAEDINARGQVVGLSPIPSGSSHGFLWQDGAWTDLGALASPNNFSYAAALNDRGDVVGYSINRSIPAASAVIWKAGTIMDLGTLTPGRASQAIDINNHGQVVGVTWDPAASTATYRAVLWTVEPDSQTTTLLPIADAYIRAGTFASANFGGASTLSAKKGVSPDNTRRSYLTFDISGINGVGRATLRLYGHLSSAATREAVTTIYAVRDTSWGERAITWNTRPDLDDVVSRVTVSGTTPRWLEIDVTKFVRAELHAGRSVVSLSLRNVVQSSASAEFGSRESGNAPQLLISQ
jgi:probable HAF family extracellular repeat protein